VIEVSTRGHRGVVGADRGMQRKAGVHLGYLAVLLWATALPVDNPKEECVPALRLGP
jgi:hypothetical protein